MESKVKAIINGKTEYLIGIEALIFLKGGEKAILNRRNFINQNKDFVSSLYKEKGASKYVCKNDKEVATMKGIYEEKP